MKKNQKLPNSKLALIKNELDLLELNEGICRNELIKKHYVIDGSWLDPFNDNNFRSTLTNARKLMPNKQFTTIKGIITRLK